MTKEQISGNLKINLNRVSGYRRNLDDYKRSTIQIYWHGSSYRKVKTNYPTGYGLLEVTGHSNNRQVVSNLT